MYPLNSLQDQTEVTFGWILFELSVPLLMPGLLFAKTGSVCSTKLNNNNNKKETQPVLVLLPFSTLSDNCFLKGPHCLNIVSSLTLFLSFYSMRGPFQSVNLDFSLLMPIKSWLCQNHQLPISSVINISNFTTFK